MVGKMAGLATGVSVDCDSGTTVLLPLREFSCAFRMKFVSKAIRRRAGGAQELIPPGMRRS
jgi:hypothetical protein